MEDKIFTEEEFNKTDYCYELNDEVLSDDTDEYIERENNNISDLTTQYEIDQIIENAKKKLLCMKKIIFKFPKDILNSIYRIILRIIISAHIMILMLLNKQA